MYLFFYEIRTIDLLRGSVIPPEFLQRGSHWSKLYSDRYLYSVMKEESPMYYFILNPSSQSFGSRSVWSRLSEKLKAQGIEYKVYATRYPGHGKEIARTITTMDPRAVVIAIGGDGTIHDILCGLTNLSTITFGVIPSGSGNDFARGMRISSDPDRAIRAVLEPTRYTKMDLGVLKDRQGERFGVSSGIGFDAAICHEALNSPIKDFLNSINLGNLTYAAICLKQIVLFEPCSMTIEADGNRHFEVPRAYFAAVMNQKYEGGGVKMIPDAKPNDGLLDLIVVGDVTKSKICCFLPMAFFGKHTRLKGLHFIKCTDVKITADRTCAVHLDGESGGMHKTLHIGLEKEKLRVITG